VEKPLLLPGSIASGKSLSLEMLKVGWVTTYEQAGAEYGEWGKDEFLRVEAEAKYAHYYFFLPFLIFVAN
jgi:endonuclease YncB( thermonuclease family)